MSKKWVKYKSTILQNAYFGEKMVQIVVDTKFKMAAKNVNEKNVTNGFLKLQGLL